MIDFSRTYCDLHPNQLITNFCAHQQCMVGLCATCICEHTQLHLQRKTAPMYENIRTTYSKMQESIRTRITALEQQKVKINGLVDSIHNKHQMIAEVVQQARIETVQFVNKFYQAKERELLRLVQAQEKKAGVRNQNRMDTLLNLISRDINSLFSAAQQINSQNFLESFHRVRTNILANSQQTHKEIAEEIASNQNFEISLSTNPIFINQVKSALERSISHVFSHSGSKQETYQSVGRQEMYQSAYSQQLYQSGFNQQLEHSHTPYQLHAHAHSHSHQLQHSHAPSQLQQNSSMHQLQQSSSMHQLQQSQLNGIVHHLQRKQEQRPVSRDNRQSQINMSMQQTTYTPTKPNQATATATPKTNDNSTLIVRRSESQPKPMPQRVGGSFIQAYPSFPYRLQPTSQPRWTAQPFIANHSTGLTRHANTSSRMELNNGSRMEVNNASRMEVRGGSSQKGIKENSNTNANANLKSSVIVNQGDSLSVAAGGQPRKVRRSGLTVFKSVENQNK